MTDHTPVPGLRLGRRPPSAKPTLRASQFLRAAAVPSVPDAVDHLDGVAFGLYHNDVAGTCGPTSLANYIRMVTAKLTGAAVEPSWEDVQRLYRFQNPGFDLAKPGNGEDNGVEMKTMLSQAVKLGFVQAEGGPKVLGFASVDVSNPEEVEAAVAIFGGVLLGLDLQTAQSAQLGRGVWDYSPSGEWGGHAVCEGAYEANEDEDCITWGQRVRMTRGFSEHQRDEAYVVVLDTHLRSRQFMEGWDLQRFAQAYQDITGRTFPVDIPTDPPVDPPVDPPAPRPLPEGLASALQAAAEDRQVVRWLTQRHVRDGKHVADKLRAVLDAYGAL